MITRFRIEGEHPDKQELIDELALIASKIIGLVDPSEEKGNWECTDDVVHAVSALGHSASVGIDKSILARPPHYKGRMVLVYRGEN
jgi:hypothetical protein